MNKLFILKLNTKPLQYIIPDTVGTPPIGRYGHCSDFLKEKNYFLVYGGRNDDIYAFEGKSVLNDIHLLNLEFMAWCKVKIGLINPSPRYNSSSFYHGNK